MKEKDVRNLLQMIPRSRRIVRSSTAVEKAACTNKLLMPGQDKDRETVQTHALENNHHDHESDRQVSLSYSRRTTTTWYRVSAKGLQ
jgi:G3E family GTPase